MVFFRIRPAAGRQGKVLVDSRIFFLSKNLKFDFWQQASIPPFWVVNKRSSGSSRFCVANGRNITAEIDD